MNLVCCIFCRHFSFDGGEADISEVTPGRPPSMSCDKNHFDLYDLEGLGAASISAELNKAERCSDFNDCGMVPWHKH